MTATNRKCRGLWLAGLPVWDLVLVPPKNGMFWRKSAILSKETPKTPRLANVFKLQWWPLVFQIGSNPQSGHNFSAFSLQFPGDDAWICNGVGLQVTPPLEIAWELQTFGRCICVTLMSSGGCFGAGSRETRPDWHEKCSGWSYQLFVKFTPKNLFVLDGEAKKESLKLTNRFRKSC